MRKIYRGTSKLHQVQLQAQSAAPQIERSLQARAAAEEPFTGGTMAAAAGAERMDVDTPSDNNSQEWTPEEQHFMRAALEQVRRRQRQAHCCERPPPGGERGRCGSEQARQRASAAARLRAALCSSMPGVPGPSPWAP